MDLVIFIGIPASGKSTFYREYFFRSHMRVNLDMLKTRNREKLLLDFCFQTQLPLVVDNTNVTAKERQKYIELGKSHQYTIRGFYFQSFIKDCLARNALRTEKERIPDIGVAGKFKQLQLPAFTEGFDELTYVRTQDGQFTLLPWQIENQSNEI
jgi:predicted kinase